LVIFFFPIWFLWARLLTRIYRSYAKGAAKELRSAKEMQQWWRLLLVDGARKLADSDQLMWK
jgi:hypothetical protein